MCRRNGGLTRGAWLLDWRITEPFQWIICHVIRELYTLYTSLYYDFNTNHVTRYTPHTTIFVTRYLNPVQHLPFWISRQQVFDSLINPLLGPLISPLIRLLYMPWWYILNMCAKMSCSHMSQHILNITNDMGWGPLWNFVNLHIEKNRPDIEGHKVQNRHKYIRPVQRPSNIWNLLQ